MFLRSSGRCSPCPGQARASMVRADVPRHQEPGRRHGDHCRQPGMKRQLREARSLGVSHGGRRGLRRCDNGQPWRLDARKGHGGDHPRRATRRHVGAPSLVGQVRPAWSPRTPPTGAPACDELSTRSTVPHIRLSRADLLATERLWQDQHTELIAGGSSPSSPRRPDTPPTPMCPQWRISSAPARPVSRLGGNARRRVLGPQEVIGTHSCLLRPRS